MFQLERCSSWRMQRTSQEGKGVTSSFAYFKSFALVRVSALCTVDGFPDDQSDKSSAGEEWPWICLVNHQHAYAQLSRRALAHSFWLEAATFWYAFVANMRC